MGTLALMAEVAALLLVAYVIGCAGGYGLHWLRHTLAALRPIMVSAPAPRPATLRRPAVRLAMASPPDETAPNPMPKPPDPKPKSLPAPRDGFGDDLQRIKGIGPKIEAILHELGVYHYDQIAGWSPANMAWMDIRLGFKGRVAREHWVPQASALAQPATLAPKVA